jgi:hypothetical protein
MMDSRMACCKFSEERDLIGVSWTNPVNISTANRIAVKPDSVCGREGMMSMAQAVLGAFAKSVLL